jgi:hypothetical protein
LLPYFFWFTPFGGFGITFDCMQIKLIRLIEIDDSTLGALMLDGWPYFSTLELGWNNNLRNISCIPMGDYKFVTYVSARHGKTIRVEAVPDRSDIIIHAGNTIQDTRGCILLGKGYGHVDDMPAVRSSRRAMKQFRNLLGDVTEGMITISGG